jgi:ferrous iron transport protein B
MVQSWREPKNRPRAVIVVVDATNLIRNTYLALQILDWNIPTIIVLNMIDEARKKRISIDADELKKRTKAWAVIPASAKYGEGIKEIIETLEQIPDDIRLPNVEPRLVEIEHCTENIAPLEHFLKEKEDVLNHHPRIEALRLLSDDGYINYLSKYYTAGELENLLNIVLLRGPSDELVELIQLKQIQR